MQTQSDRFELVATPVPIEVIRLSADLDGRDGTNLAAGAAAFSVRSSAGIRWATDVNLRALILSGRRFPERSRPPASPTPNSCTDSNSRFKAWAWGPSSVPRPHPVLEAIPSASPCTIMPPSANPFIKCKIGLMKTIERYEFGTEFRTLSRYVNGEIDADELIKLLESENIPSWDRCFGKSRRGIHF